MEITVHDSAEFKRLLEALVNELIDAREHFDLHQNLNALLPDYGVEFNQSAGFWNLTMTAHIDASLLRLCRAYDLYRSKPNLNLKNFLETIKANLHFFDEQEFRERLKGNAFVDSLAKEPRKPDPAELERDLKSVGKDAPLVKKLIFWRNSYVAHRSRGSALDPQGFAVQNPLLFPEIRELISNGTRIVNRYSSLFSATVHTSFPIKDYRRLLDAVRRDLEVREARIHKAVEA
ncbi:MAG TPA: hypothetical protein VF860_07140 [Candidatus Acidoferrales bacterium]